MINLIRNKSVYLIFLLFLLVVSLLYTALGHQLVAAMYEGRAPDILNNLIKYQHKKPVEHYLVLADKLFYRTVFEVWLFSCLALPFFIILRSFFRHDRPLSVESELTVAQPHGSLSACSQYSISHIKIIFFAALLVRIAFLPFVVNLPLAGDEEYYWSVPKLLADGDFSSTVLRPPLWGYLLAIPAAVLDQPIAGRILAALIGACTAPLAYLLGTRLFDKRTGLIAGLIYAFYPEHVAYSHGLWSEVLFGFLGLLWAYLFFLFAEDKQKNKFLFLSFFVGGFALLAKEFAVILFAGLVVAMFFLKTKHKIRKALICCFLFFLPAFAYSLTLSCITKRVVVLSDAPVSNFRQVVIGENFTYDFDKREELVSGLIGAVGKRTFRQTIRTMKSQFYNLWTPNSFPIVRLLAGHTPEIWDYGLSRPWPWVYLVAGGYIFVILAGLTGLCLARPGPFKNFAIVSLVCLSSTCILALLCSRHRFPFTFIFILYTAHLLVNAKALLGNPKNTARIVVLVILLRLFAEIVLCKLPTFGSWG